MRDLKESSAALVAAKLDRLAQDTGMPMDDLRDLWLTETADRLDSASRSLDSGNFTETVRHVHSAAGTSGMCGAVPLAALLSSIEQLAAAERKGEAREALDAAREDFAQLTRELKRGSA